MEEIFSDKGKQLYQDIREDIRLICLKMTSKFYWRDGSNKFNRGDYYLFKCKCISYINNDGYMNNYDRKKNSEECDQTYIVLKEYEFKILEKCKNSLNLEWDELIAC